MARPLSAPAALAAPRRAPHGALLPWLVLLGLTVPMMLASEAVPWAFKYPPPWVVPLKGLINALMTWLRDDASFGLFTFQELTRAVSWLVEQPFRLADSLLSTGLLVGVGQDAVELWPPIPWFALIAALTVTAHYAGGRGLALLVALCFLYLALFGQWASAMTTLASIVIAVPLGIALGGSLGIAAFRHPRFERAITPFLDLMQTVPVFAYLVPILWFFGFNPVAAMMATIIYAMPPMVRNTVLALQRVPAEVVDFGQMAGCTRRQMLWKVLMPSARPGLMVGVNQVIMLSLNMVIIASMIGAGGLGHEVLAALRRLDFGAGLEAALAITLLAIALDGLSQAFARRPPPSHGEHAPNFVRRHPHLLSALAVLLGGWVFAAAWPAASDFPAALQVSTGGAVNAGMAWLNIHLFDAIEAVKSWLLINFMVPLKRLLLGLPWPIVIAGIALAGWQLGGARLALQTAALALFIALTGNWANGVETVYLCGLSVIIACLIGIPIGVWAARNRSRAPSSAGGGRHPADPACIRLSDPRCDAVPRRRLRRDARGRSLLGRAGDPLYRPRHRSDRPLADRSRPRGRLHPRPAAAQGPAAARAAGDHARGQPDHHDGALDAGDHCAGRHPRARPGGLHRADQSGRWSRPGRGRVRRVHRDDRRPSDRAVGGGAQAPARHRLMMAMTSEAAARKAAGLACWRGAVVPIPLGGGISNHNFLVEDRGARFFVRIAEDCEVHNVLRRFELAASRAAHAAGISPEMVHAEPGAMVFRYVEGRTLVPEDVRDPAMLARIVPLVRVCHCELPRHFRGPAPIFWVFQVLRDYAARLVEDEHRLARELPRYVAVADRLMAAVGPVEIAFGHNDLLAANLIDDGERLWLVDWEYAGFNSPLFDLGGLASNNELVPELEGRLLELYFGAPASEDLRRRYQAMKCASLLREAMWSMVSEVHLTVDFDYEAYTAENLARFEKAYAELA